jgi:hypothetical protein
MRALKKVPIYQNQLWAMEQLVQQKEELSKRRDDKAAEKAERLERERLDKLRRDEEDLAARKAISRPLQPMNRKRASSDDSSEPEEEKYVEKKKRTPKKKPQVEEKKPDTPSVRSPPKMYKLQNKQEWDRWNAFLGYTESEWHYGNVHGIEALERLVARGENHLIPEMLSGPKTSQIEPPALVPIRIPVATPEVVQEAAAELPLPNSPVPDNTTSSLTLRNLFKRGLFLS